MDITEIYIKMCDCEEIQKQWSMKAGDWLRIRGSKYVSLAYESTARGESGFAEPDAVWLPRQDQLQEMVKEKFLGWTYPGVLNELQKLCFEISHYDSMEQLWLAFVMKELYSKTWDGDKWQIT